MVESYDAVAALLGGASIGLSAVLLLAVHGHLAGISGILNGALSDRSREGLWRWLFLGGLVLGSAACQLLIDAKALSLAAGSPLLYLCAGALVGVGTRLSGGCTSGHGVCGLGLRSGRSLAAVVTFMATGFLTVYCVRHVWGQP